MSAALYAHGGRAARLLCVLLLLTGPAVGHVAAIPVFVADAVPIGETNPRLEVLLADTLDAELRSAGLALAASPDEDATVLLEVRYLLAGTRVTLLLTAREPVQQAVIGGGVYAGTADLALVTTVRQAAEAIAAQLAAAAAVEGELPRPPVVLLQLTLRSPDEGATVLLADDAEVGTISGGSLELPFVPVAVGSDLTVRLQREGYQPLTHTIAITRERMVAELPPLRPRVDWEIGFSWMPQRWAAAAVALRRYVVPERLYLQSTNQLGTRYRFTEGSRASGLFDTRLSIGVYPIAAAEGAFRLGFSTGAGLTVTVLGGEEQAYFFADPYFNVFSVAGKWRFDRFAPYLQLDAVYYGEADTGHLVRGTHHYASLGVLLPWNP